MVTKKKLTRDEIAKRIAQDLQDGDTVNLGVGIPVLVSNYVPEGREIIYHSENGVLGMGPLAKSGQEDPDLVNAAKQPVTLLPGASFSHHADSFSMTRGHHVDVAVMGGMQVSEKGDLANWKVKGAKYGSIGGAMDIAIGVKKLFIAMTHVNKNGEFKIVKELTYPVTALKCVKRIYTDLAVIEVTFEGLYLLEIAPGFTLEEVQKLTEPPLLISSNFKEIMI